MAEINKHINHLFGQIPADAAGLVEACRKLAHRCTEAIAEPDVIHAVDHLCAVALLAAGSAGQHAPYSSEAPTAV